VVRGKPPPAAFSGSPDEVEAEFYEALQRGDIERLMALWADDDEIVCVHPGGGRMVGAGAIRASFTAIFANGGIPVVPEQVHRLHQLSSALHHLVERITVSAAQNPGGEGGTQTAWVLTTNFYVKTAAGWRMACHHASPGLPAEVAGAPGTHDAPGVLH
jgi:ketosteroid isomerase-like protein